MSGPSSSSSNHVWTSTSLLDGNLNLVTTKKPSDLQVILRTRHHDAFYNSASKQLTLQTRPHLDGVLKSTTAQSSQPLISRRQSATTPNELTATACPTCLRSWALPTTAEQQHVQDQPTVDQPDDDQDSTPFGAESPSFIAHNYFRLLAEATSVPPSTFNTRPSTPNFSRNRFESESGSSTPEPASRRSTGPQGGVHLHEAAPEPIDHGAEVDGYYARFFVELKKLGHGARGQVFLCQHVLNGNKLGKYAVKKIPVGEYANTLLNSLNEVQLMESLGNPHPNLIHYQHAWIERCQFSPFGPSVPTLFVLMMAANGGSLADWISARAGDMAENDSPAPSNTTPASADVASSRSSKHVERLKAALRQRRAQRPDRQAWSTPSTATFGGVHAGPAGVGVHLLREEEIHSLLKDITSGLAFLHDKGILHLDIKPANVLLNWDEDALIPRAMLSDFGSSLLMHDNWTRTRSGHTGTMEYMSPETVIPDSATGQLKELSSKADIWSLGMILHLLLFFSLPIASVEDVSQLRAEMQTYTGFSRRTSPAAQRAQRTDPTLLGLLERMLQVDPKARPSCKEILQILTSRPSSSGEGKQKGATSSSLGRNVSMALYRPSTLSSMQPQILADIPTDVHSAASFLERTVLPVLGIRNLDAQSRAFVQAGQAVALAFVKTMSPALLLSNSSPGSAKTFTQSALALINLLAMVELAYALSSRSNTRVGGSALGSHLTLMFAVVHSAILVSLLLNRAPLIQPSFP